MARTTKQLTDKEIATAKPKAKEYLLADGGGLLLRIKPNGSKLWRFNYYKPFTKKRTEISLGNYPDLSLSQARVMREEYRALLAQGVDPKNHREQQEQAERQRLISTFGTIAEQWRAKKAAEIEPVTLAKNWRRLELYLFPTFADVPISDILPATVIQALEPLNRQGKGDTLKRTLRLLNEILFFAVLSGAIPFNPCRDIKDRYHFGRTAHNPTIRPEELPELIHRLYHSKITLFTRYLILWQLLTMPRPNEASRAEWAEIDFNRALWTIPAEKMKRRIAHTIPLSTQAIRLLNEMRHFTGTARYIFQSLRNPARSMNSQSTKGLLS